MISPVATQRSYAKLEKLLQQSVGRFGNYQTIAPAIIERCPQLAALNYEQQQIDLDAQRYQWLLQHYPADCHRVTEIGASLGYFSLSLAAERGAMVMAHEPISEYAQAANLLVDLSGLKEKVHFTDNAITLDSLNRFPVTDLVIHLNVLHHAGSIFDQNKMTMRDDWHDYAIIYLTELAKKSRFLFFQTGNMWENDRLFPGDQTVRYTSDLLKASGWSVVSMGIIEDGNHPCYQSYTPDTLDEAPIITCRRNPETGLVDYYRDQQVVAQLSTGLLQRPLWFCERHHVST